jgi:hypothetical protein
LSVEGQDQFAWKISQPTLELAEKVQESSKLEAMTGSVPMSLQSHRRTW